MQSGHAYIGVKGVMQSGHAYWTLNVCMQISDLSPRHMRRARIAHCTQCDRRVAIDVCAKGSGQPDLCRPCPPHQRSARNGWLPSRDPEYATLLCKGVTWELHGAKTAIGPNLCRPCPGRRGSARRGSPQGMLTRSPARRQLQVWTRLCPCTGESRAAATVCAAQPAAGSRDTQSARASQCIHPVLDKN